MNKKKKTFIMTIPFQPPGGLKKTRYYPKNCSELKYGETHFPIIPVIAHHARDEKEVRIVIIKTEGENYEWNYKEIFLPEIEEIRKELGVSFELETITTKDEETIDVQLKLFERLINVIEDNEELYVCITYGTKPTPIALFLALSYAYRLKEGTSVERVVYGKHFHKEPPGDTESLLFDTTALFYMDAIVNRLAEAKVANPIEVIGSLLNVRKYEEGFDE